MFISPTEPPDPSQEGAEHQKAAAYQSQRHSCHDRGRTNFLLDHAKRPQHIPKLRPNQKAENAEDDEDGEQHTGYTA